MHQKLPESRPIGAAIAVLVIIALPLVALLPLGFVWVLQSGWFIHWTLFATLSAVSALWVWSRWRMSLQAEYVPADVPRNAAWTPRDEAAWAGVQQLAKDVDVGVLGDSRKLTALGRQVFETVASHYRGPNRHAVWGFTLPEALLLAERIAHEMRARVQENVPLGDRIRIDQVLRIYGWKSYADRAVDSWRLFRLHNPAQALVAETRAYVTKSALQPVTGAVQKRIAGMLVGELGRAAVDLYGGHFRLSHAEALRHVSRVARQDAEQMTAPAEPLRMLVVGQGNAGKSSLINALSEEVRAEVDVLPATDAFKAYQIEGHGMPVATIIDTPGLSGDVDQLPRLIDEAAKSDLVIWVVAANRASREIDRQALDRYRAYFTALPDRRRPPLVLVLSHVDRLRPFTEWAPPYDLGESGSTKSRSISEAVAAVCEELGIDVEDVVPACLEQAIECYNLDVVWAQISRKLPEAQKSLLQRLRLDAREGWTWSGIWAQAVGAGRVCQRTMFASSKAPRSGDAA